MERKFFDFTWCKDAVAATVGTLVGIILTFGITFVIEHRNKQEIVHKIAVMTLHNIDASIETMEGRVAQLQWEDSVITHVYSHFPDRLDRVSTDTLSLFVQIVTYFNMYGGETYTSSIFSNSFEVWQFIDDDKVISRINNAYDILGKCNEICNSLEKLRKDVFEGFYIDRPITDYPSIREAATALAMRPDARLLFTEYYRFIKIIPYFLDIVRQLNDYNKKELDISQQELDEAGNLLEQNKYRYHTSDIN